MRWPQHRFDRHPPGLLPKGCANSVTCDIDSAIQCSLFNALGTFRWIAMEAASARLVCFICFLPVELEMGSKATINTVLTALKCVFEHRAFLTDKPQIPVRLLEQGNIRKGVTFDGDEISTNTCCNLANFALHLKQLRCCKCR